MNPRVREHRGLHSLFPWPGYSSEHCCSAPSEPEKQKLSEWQCILESNFRIIPKIFPPLGLEAFLGHLFTALVGKWGKQKEKNLEPFKDFCSADGLWENLKTIEWHWQDCQ